MERQSVKSVSKTESKFTLFDMKFVYMLTPVLLGMACVQSNTLLAKYIPVLHFCNLLDQYLIQLGVIQKLGVSLEACIAFVCWATTYLFVRRLLNPETAHEALYRFSADCFYGGLAAGASVYLKTFLVAQVSGR